MNVLRMVRVPWWYCFHVTARAAALLLFGAWLALFMITGVSDEGTMPFGVYAQFVTLVIMFSAYALGWRKALGGGLLGLAAWAAFYAVTLLDVGRFPMPAFALFAVPSLLYLTAYGLYRRGY